MEKLTDIITLGIGAYILLGIVVFIITLAFIIDTWMFIKKHK